MQRKQSCCRMFSSLLNPSALVDYSSPNLKMFTFHRQSQFHLYCQFYYLKYNPPPHNATPIASILKTSSLYSSKINHCHRLEWFWMIINCTILSVKADEAEFTWKPLYPLACLYCFWSVIVAYNNEGDADLLLGKVKGRLTAFNNLLQWIWSSYEAAGQRLRLPHCLLPWGDCSAALLNGSTRLVSRISFKMQHVGCEPLT